MLLSTLVTWIHAQDSLYWIYYGRQKALGQVCVKILGLSPIIIIPPLLQIHSHIISQARQNGPVTWYSSTDAAPPQQE
jgi:hypothetical protein